MIYEKFFFIFFLYRLIKLLPIQFQLFLQKNDVSSINTKKNTTTSIPSSDLLLDMLLVNVSPELVQIGERELAFRARDGVVAVALKVVLQVVNPGKSLLANWAGEMAFFRQVGCLVTFKIILPLEGFATATLEDLGAKMDVVVAPQGGRIVEDVSTDVASIIFYLTVHVLLVHSQISRPCSLVVAKIATKSICVGMELQVPFQLGEIL